MFHTNPDFKSSECTYRYDYVFFSNKYLTYDHAHLLNHAHIRRITEYLEKMEPNIRKHKTMGLDSPKRNTDVFSECPQSFYLMIFSNSPSLVF